MSRPPRLFDSPRRQDLDDVIRLWREIGHTPKSIDQYRLAVIQILDRAVSCKYRDLAADRVDSWARQYAAQHDINPAGVMRRWLPAFRAFAWGLSRLGKEVGSIHRSKAEPKLDPLVERFIEHGRSLGWKKNTLRLHLRTLQ